MYHFGILCPILDGHLNPMTTLGRELVMRGHRVTLFGILDAKARAVAAGLDFCALAEIESPLGSVSKALDRFSKLDERDHEKYMITLFQQGIVLNLLNAPQAIQRAGVDALLIDQCVFEGETIAQVTDIPFITVCTALMLNPDLNVPTPFKLWNYELTWQAYIRNMIGNIGVGLFALQPVLEIINKYRSQWKLRSYNIFDNLWSKLAQINQQPAEFEFPRIGLAKYVHFVGPFISSHTQSSVSFPYDRLNGKPIIYASLGTIQNYRKWIFHTIAEACLGIDAQLVITLGESDDSELLPRFPGNPLVVKYAPQLDLLQRAALTITHAGLNTVLGSLCYGVPMVAIPLASEQPGIAARITWTGTGEVVPLSNLTVPRLRTAIHQVLNQKSYKQNAIKIQKAIRKAGGVSRAADIVQQVLSTGKPVYRQ